MSTEKPKEETVHLSVENIGGINETSVSLAPGVTVLGGRNATNRTSLLQAVMAVLGSEGVTLKSDADEGYVELTIGDDTYTRTLIREGDTVLFSGDPYLADPELADLFAFCLETNEARQAVARDDDLRDIILRPVDTDEIQADIQRLRQNRNRIDEQIEERESLKKRLPKLQARKTTLEENIETKREELAEKEERIASFDADIEQTREQKEALESALTDLREKRSALEDVRSQIETEQSALEELRAERRELEETKEDLPESPTDEISELDSAMERLRTRKQRLETELNEVQSALQFNEEMLEDASGDILEQSDGDSEVTDQLLPDSTVQCWTCGTEVDMSQIETTLDKLRDISRETLSEVTDLEDEIDDLQSRKDTLEEQQNERETVDARLSELEEEIASSEARIEKLQNRRDGLTEDVADIEDEIDRLEQEKTLQSDLLDIHKEANQLEYDIGKLESDLDDVTEEISSLEDKINEIEELEKQRRNVETELKDLRTRIDRIERQAIEEFNNGMETVLELLDYQNIDRIWIEQYEEEVREGRRKVTESRFQLHVIRSTDSGVTYEDTVDNLSESEREVTGLVFALAGYLTHDVAEEVPFLLLDSLEAIDSERIATLVEYFEQHTEYLVVALLPEDAAALDDSYAEVSDI